MAANKNQHHSRRRHCGPLQAAKRKAKYAAMPMIVERNRRRKRLKHLSLHPGDIQALAKFKKLLV